MEYEEKLDKKLDEKASTMSLGFFFLIDIKITDFRTSNPAKGLDEDERKHYEISEKSSGFMRSLVFYLPLNIT